MLVWCEPMERKSPQLIATDISHAITWFREETGQEPRLIMVHPSLEAMARENSNGIAVQAVGGCLAWEVWLSLVAKSPQTLPPEKPQPVDMPEGSSRVTPTEEPPPSSPPDASESKSGRDKTKARGKLPTAMVSQGGLPLKKIMRWHNKGLSTRTIADRLSGQGSTISYRTIARVISRQLQLSMEVNEGRRT